MAHKVRNVYLESLVITIFVFLSGIMFGIWLDNYRIVRIRQNLLSDAVFWDDSLFLSKYFQIYGKRLCNESLKLNLLYNERIYERGKLIEDAIRESKFTPELKEELKRYVLMQTQFWLNSIELKKRCNFTYHNVVHLQKFYPESLQERIDNKAQSTIMLDLKQMCGNRVMLIPIVADLNLTTVDAIKTHYRIKKLPAVIIDEKYVLQGLTPLEKLNEYTRC